MFLHLVEITRFQKHTDGLLRCRGKTYSHVKNNLVYTQSINSSVNGLLMQIWRNATFFWIKNALKISQFQCHWKGTYLLRYSPKNVQFGTYYFLIVLSNSLPKTDNFLNKFSWKSIYWKWYSIGILLLPNVYATSYFLKNWYIYLK